MGLNITSFPEREINENPDTVSKWNAVHHPVKFELQRQDLQAYYSINITGGLKVWVNSVSEVVIGDSVYISSGTNKGIGVVAVKNTGDNSFECTFTGAGTILQSGGFVNLNSARQNYYAVTRVLGVNSDNTYYEIGESLNKPDSTGKIIVDVSSWLKSLVDYVDLFQYDVINWKDESLGGRFNITYSENWTGSEGEFIEVSGSNLYYFINACKQIQQAYGSNVGDFVPFIEYDTADTRAKFLCDFEVPTYFVGYPFSLDFIYSESMAPKVIYKKERVVDVNGTILTTITTELDANQRVGVNRMMLEVDDTTARKLGVWLQTSLADVELLYVADDYVAFDYIAPITTLPDVVVPTVLTEAR